MRLVCCIWLFITTTVCVGAEQGARQIPQATTPRERFLNLIDRPRVPLQAVERILSDDTDIQKSRIEYSSDVGHRVPGLLLRSKSRDSKRPVVIVLHGTGGSKQAMEPLLRKFAERQMIAVAIDARYCGERAGGLKAGEAYRTAILETWRSGKGFPFYYDTVWDLLRLIDYLETRPDVDAQRIGAIGFSKGGTELYLAAAVDDRFAAAVPCIGVQSFAWALEHNAWQSRISTIQAAVDGAARDAGLATIDAAFVRQFYQRVVPGIHQEFDGPVMLPLIAPRPLLVINGDQDDRTPVPGVELCVQAARTAYEQSHASQRFKFVLQPNTKHAVNPDAERLAIEWLMEQLGSADLVKSGAP